eukprot:scaffold15305_cov126-Cylindrotheca_fusiformis.AAC.15
MPPSISWRLLSSLLATLVLFQWLVLAVMLRPDEKCSSSARSDPSIHQIESSSRIAEQKQKFDQNPISNFKTKANTRVAVSVMLKAPKWFHRRYTAMLHNALANLPSSWSIQIFYNEKWLESDVLPLHPGLRMLRETNERIVWTRIPQEMTRWKPKDLLKSSWIWESMIAENVLMFGGNGAFCGNRKVSIDYFLQFDYVGAPWLKYYGKGGDGSSHSFRHRSAMLDIIKEHPPNDGDAEYNYFIKHMIKDSSKYKIAGPNVTAAFAGGTRDTPLLLSGTQAHANWTTRESMLATCPELKIIFPSLHEPSCFGAHPNGEECKKTICALNEIPPQGC